MSKKAYMYHLATWYERDKTLLCPGCHLRLCYKEYFDKNGNPVDPINHLCGKCDHEWCGYHVNPKDFKEQNGDIDLFRKPKHQKQMKRIEIDRSLVAKSMKGYDRNVFVKWLYSLPWDEETYNSLPHILFLYCVGTSKNGGTIWWQVDEEATVRTGKIMQYLPNGHRDKSNFGTWVHSLMKEQFPADKYQLVQCLFGQHLLKRNDMKDIDVTVNIVESEKTALLMACFDNDFGRSSVWMACGGLQNLSEQKLLPLRGHPICLYPDTNGVELWKKKMEQMNIPRLELATEWMSVVNEDDPPGADIADVYLRRMLMQPEEKLKELRRRFPDVDILIKKLALTL